MAPVGPPPVAPTAGRARRQASLSNWTADPRFNVVWAPCLPESGAAVRGHVVTLPAGFAAAMGAAGGRRADAGAGRPAGWRNTAAQRAALLWAPPPPAGERRPAGLGGGAHALAARPARAPCEQAARWQQLFAAGREAGERRRTEFRQAVQMKSRNGFSPS